MKKPMHALLLLPSLIGVTQSIFTEDPRRCVADSNVTAFSGCSNQDALATSCGSYAATSDATGYFNCYCQQKYLNAIYDCNSEQRMCLGNSDVDVNFSDDYYSWHSWCDPIVNYSPTTPVLSSITASFQPSYCVTAQDACTSMYASRAECANMIISADTIALRSCLCTPPVLSLEFTCSFLGNISCGQVPANTEHMSGYTYCPNAATVWTVPESLTASLGTGTTAHYSYYTPSSSSSATSPATPAGTITRSDALPTTTAASSVATSFKMFLGMHRSPWRLVILGILLAVM